MASFKNPTFQDRAGQAAAARREALDQLRSRPAPDEKLAAQRKEAAERREKARIEKAEAKKLATALAAQAKADAAAKAAVPVPTEEERKAERDARYAARKKKKR